MNDPLIPDRTTTIESPVHALTKGNLIAGKYRIIEEIGRGGMGIVYRAEDIKLDRPVALKFLPPQSTSEPEARERFIHEARAASALDHPDICVIHEIGETDTDQIYIAMAFYDGESLRDKVRRGPMKPDEAITMAMQVAQGMAKAHQKGIIHRDIKPANILITTEGVAKILDFGLAKLAGQIRLTKEGSTVGTVAYMSPEQVKGEPVDQRTDIWALGVVLYEMVTGRLPFKGDVEQGLVHSILTSDPEPVLRIREDLPKGLDQVIFKALAKSPSARYKCMEELIEDLGAVAEGLKPPRARGRKLTWRKIALPVVAAGVLILGGLYFVSRLLKSNALPLVVGKMSIAVISFDNLTGDGTLDYLQRAVPNLLITSLEQSGFVNVTTWERMNDLLKQLGIKETSFIDKNTGFKLCRMEGVEKIVIGSVTKAGDTYATDVKVLDVRSKALLTSAKAMGEGLDSILKTQIDDLSRDVFRGVGLSAADIHGLPAKISDLTTGSMEAYRFYVKGLEDADKYFYDSARRYFEKAVALDPGFAMAYAGLFYANTWLNNSQALYAALNKAREHSSRATEKERLYIDACYTHAVEKNAKGYRQKLEELIKKYPKEKRYIFELASYVGLNEPDQAVPLLKRALALDPNWTRPINELAIIFTRLGQYEKSQEALQRLASLTPEDPNIYETMGHNYFAMGLIDQAIARFREALEIKPDFAWSLASIAYGYAFKETYSEALSWMRQYVERTQEPGVRAEGSIGRAFYLYWLGRRTEALAELSQADQASAQLGDMTRRWMNYLRGWIYADESDYEQSERFFAQAFEGTDKSTWKSYYLGLKSCVQGYLDVKRGNTAAAKAELAVIAAARPEFFQEQIAYCGACLAAEIYLQEGSPRKAVEAIVNSKPHTVEYINHPSYQMRLNLPARKDLLARAYLAAGDIDGAIAEYEKLATFDPHQHSSFLIWPPHNYELAKLYEQIGSKAKAANRYLRFLDLWKDADADIPEVDDARSRLRGLRAK